MPSRIRPLPILLGVAATALLPAAAQAVDCSKLLGPAKGACEKAAQAARQAADGAKRTAGEAQSVAGKVAGAAQQAAGAVTGLAGELLKLLDDAKVKELVSCLRGTTEKSLASFRKNPAELVRGTLESAIGTLKSAFDDARSTFKPFAEDIARRAKGGEMPALDEMVERVADAAWGLFARAAGKAEGGRCVVVFAERYKEPVRGLGRWAYQQVKTLWSEKILPLVQESVFGVAGTLVDLGIEKLGEALGDRHAVTTAKQIVARHLVFARMEELTTKLAPVARAVAARDTGAAQSAWAKARAALEDADKVSLPTMVDIARDVLTHLGKVVIDNHVAPLALRVATLAVRMVKGVVLRVVNALTGLIPFAGGAIGAVATKIVSAVAKLFLWAVEYVGPLAAKLIYEKVVAFLAEKMKGVVAAKAPQGRGAERVAAAVSKLVPWVQRWASAEASVINAYNAQVKALGDAAASAVGTAKK